MLLRFITRMKFHQLEEYSSCQICNLDSDGSVHQPSTLCSCKSSCIRCFHYYSGWVGVRKIKNKDQLSPAETETRAELGNKQRTI